MRVSEVVGKRIKLLKRGREFLGLCPFHNDSKPSLSIVDEKNFYHCFACGAHGDIIKFTMEVDGFNFPEAVEKLASIAGLEMPQQNPEEIRKEARRRTLKEVMEEATRYYEKLLWESADRAGINYLRSRGLSDRIIKAFRLGYAPDGGSNLLQAMKKLNIDDDLLNEVGLVRVSESRSTPYDYFRNRVLFPIGDRRGKIIGFGGRLIGSGEPKYLNSPETPLFQKGRVLYGVAQAREVAVKKEEIIVAEGYMDVISLAEAGIGNAVAPLGTALTEDQIRELWRFAREPYVCFDGDEAGLRAASRASERCLPILKPGYSLRFISLSDGEDPDDIVKKGGGDAFRDLVDSSMSLSDFIWDQERSLRPADTPERQADFFSRIRNRIREIANKSVQEAYRDSMEAKIREYRFAAQSIGNSLVGDRVRNQVIFSSARGARNSRAAKSSVLQTMAQRQKQSILAAFLNHPLLFEEFGEALGYLEFNDPFLDKLRLDILDIVSVDGPLNSEKLKKHLKTLGYDDSLGGVLTSGAMAHAGFAGPQASIEQVKNGVRELLLRVGKHQLEEQLATAKMAVMKDFNEVNWNRLSSLRAALVAVNDGTSLEETT